MAAVAAILFQITFWYISYISIQPTATRNKHQKSQNS